MTCDPPSKPSWRDALFLRHLCLFLIGLGVMAVGILVPDRWAGLLPPLGSLLVLIGSSGLAQADTAFRSIAALLSGSPEHRERLVAESRALEHRMVEAATPICPPAQVRFAIGEATLHASRTWRDQVNEAFRWYLMCQTVTIAYQKAAEADPAFLSLSPAQLQAVVVSLHRTSAIPAHAIARILDVDIDVVRQSLADSRGGHR